MAVIYEQQSWAGEIIDEKERLSKGAVGLGSTALCDGSRPRWWQSDRARVSGQLEEPGRNAGVEALAPLHQLPSHSFWLTPRSRAFMAKVALANTCTRLFLFDYAVCVAWRQTW